MASVKCLHPSMVGYQGFLQGQEFHPSIKYKYLNLNQLNRSNLWDHSSQHGLQGLHSVSPSLNPLYKLVHFY